MSMATNWQERTELLYGTDRMERVRHARILIVGTGGVGAYAAEMLVRAGVGQMVLVDADTVQPSNINRQLCALHSTVGQDKVRVLEQRFLDINPELQLEMRAQYLEAEAVGPLLENSPYDFIIDAIDTIAPKCALIAEAVKRHIPIVSSMGAGAKTDITQIRFASIWDTYHCGLAKAVRNRLTRLGLKGCRLPVVFCTQQANRAAVCIVQNERNKKTTTGTVSYMPAAFGCFLAQYVLEHI